MPEGKGYNSKPTANAAKSKNREMQDRITPDGSHGWDKKSVANPWDFMDTGEVKHGPGEFHEGGGKAKK